MGFIYMKIFCDSCFIYFLCDVYFKFSTFNCCLPYSPAKVSTVKFSLVQKVIEKPTCQLSDKLNFFISNKNMLKYVSVSTSIRPHKILVFKPINIDFYCNTRLSAKPIVIDF